MTAIAVFVLAAACAGTTPASASAGSVASPATETSTDLTLASPSSVVVDNANGHLFFYGGRASTYIEVLNLDGTPDTTITAAGIVGLGLSADGSTLYAASLTDAEILAISTSTLQVTRTYPTGSGVIPGSLAVSEGKVWFTNENQSLAFPMLEELDPATGTVTATTAGTTSWGAQVKSSDLAPGILVWTSGTSPDTVSVSNVSSGTPVLVGTIGRNPANPNAPYCDAGGDFAIDSTDVLLHCGGVTSITAYSLTNVAQDGIYTVPGSLIAISGVAVAPNGQIALGTSTLMGVATGTVYYFSAAGSAPVSSYGTWGDAEGVDMGWSGGGATTYYEVYTDVGAELETVRATSTITLDISQPPKPGDTLTGSIGSSAGAAFAGDVTITKGDFIGTVAVAPVSADGSFSFIDPDVSIITEGSTYYTLTYPGDAAHAPTTLAETVDYIQVAYPLSTVPKNLIRPGTTKTAPTGLTAPTAPSLGGSGGSRAAEPVPSRPSTDISSADAGHRATPAAGAVIDSGRVLAADDLAGAGSHTWWPAAAAIFLLGGGALALRRRW